MNAQQALRKDIDKAQSEFLTLSNSYYYKFSDYLSRGMGRSSQGMHYYNCSEYCRNAYDTLAALRLQVASCTTLDEVQSMRSQMNALYVSEATMGAG